MHINFWYPIAASDTVLIDKPLRTQVIGVRLVAWINFSETNKFTQYFLKSPLLKAVPGYSSSTGVPGSWSPNTTIASPGRLE